MIIIKTNLYSYISKYKDWVIRFENKTEIEILSKEINKRIILNESYQDLTKFIQKLILIFEKNGNSVIFINFLLKIN